VAVGMTAGQGPTKKINRHGGLRANSRTQRDGAN
jgi:hypothetical protein